MNDFIYKLGIVIKELHESRVWLRMVKIREMAVPASIEPVYQECDELRRIIAASRRTAEQNSRGKRNQEFRILNS